jgi:NitT/TauT family transport system substrate-binding protein
MRTSSFTRRQASALLLGSAALSTFPSLVNAQTRPSLRVAATPLETSAAVYFARDMGFFAKADLDLDIQPMLNGAAIAAAVLSGAIDIGYCPIDVLAAIHSKGIPVAVVAPCSEYVAPATSRLTGLALAADSTVRQAKDLTGKTIAVGTLNGLSEIATQAWIDASGGDSTTVKFVETSNSTIPVALASGRADAGFVVEPFLSVLSKKERVLVYGMDAIARRFLIAGWFATSAWAKDHTEGVKRFGLAMHEAAVWANQNVAKSAGVVAKYTRLDPAVVATMTRSHYAEELTPALLQPLIDVAAKYGKFGSFPAQDLIYLQSR